MIRSERKELRLTPELSKQIDDARGDVSFNRFVERALESALSDGKVSSSLRDARVPAQPRSASTPAPKKNRSIRDTWAR